MVELAFCVPLIVLLVGGTIETCDLIFLRNSLTAAAYSGTLEASRYGSTEATVRDQIEQTLSATSVESATIVLSGPNGSAFDQSVRGDFVSIQVSAAVADNQRLSGFLQPRSTISVSAQALR